MAMSCHDGMWMTNSAEEKGDLWQWLAAKTNPTSLPRAGWMDDLSVDDEGGQLFWTTPTSGTSEPASVKWTLIGDGEYHDYVLPLAENMRWGGRITTFRLDPCSHEGAKVSIDEIRMSKDEG